MNKITVIYHRADFDGIFCCEIARKFLGETAEYVGWDYNDPTPTIHEGVETIYILDLSVPDLMADARVIWIDHHKSAIEKYPATIPGYRIDGVAACRLAWQWFQQQRNWLPDGPNVGDEMPEKSDFINRAVEEPYAVQLAGEYDIWDKRNPEAEVFQFGLRSGELTETDWKKLLCTDTACGCESFVEMLLDNGRLLQRYQQNQDKSLMKRSFFVEFEGLKFLAINTGIFNSLTFAALDVPETGHDALFGFRWDGQQWTVSLYHAKHNTGIDLSLIAAKYGGGGHRGACGFRAAKLPFLP